MFKKYYDWIFSQHEEGLRKVTGEGYNIFIEAVAASAYVNMYEIHGIPIVELGVVNTKTGENTFYLHFDFKDLNRAKDLYRQMIEHLMKQLNSSRTKVVLCCSSALTTSFFMTRLNKAAEVLELEMDFYAIGYENLFVKGFESDIILLAPQVSYLQKRAEEILKGRIVRSIPASIFGSYDINGLLNMITQAQKEEEEKKKLTFIPALRMKYGNTPMILIVSVIVESRSVQLVYRVYDQGHMIHQIEVLKETFELEDIADMLAVTLGMYEDVEDIVINTPGVYTDGKLTFRSAGIIGVDVQEYFSRFNRRVIIVNDANAMALGYYGLQKKSENIAFYFHPHAARTAGVGNIVSGRLIKGHHGLAGEMQYIHKITAYSDDPARLALTPEGTLEIVSRYLVSIIASYAPEIIAVYCDMVPDIDELKQEVGKFIQPEFLPEIVKVENVIEYMFVGGIMEYIRINAETARDSEASAYEGSPENPA